MTYLPHLLAAVLATTIVHAQVQAQSQADFPSKPITIVVPYSAGGTSDFQVRLIAKPLADILGTPVIVENKAGASGAIASAFVARSEPDGHTLLYPNNGLLIAPLVNPQAGYDPLKDFAPVSLVTRVPMVLFASKQVPANNLRELIAYAKSHPGQLNYATAGLASYGNLATNLFMQAAGIKMTHVPYRGEANTALALRTNEAQVSLTTPSGTMFGFVKEGTVKLMGVATEKPTDVVPDARPIAETVPGFVSEVWFGLLAPAGTPPAAVAKINAAVRQVLEDTKIRASLFATGAVAGASTPEEFDKLLKAEHARFAAVVRENEIRAD